MCRYVVVYHLISISKNYVAVAVNDANKGTSATTSTTTAYTAA